MQTIPVMINGLPGNMAACAARHIRADQRFNLIPVSLTGPEIALKTFSLDQTQYQLIHPDDHQNALVHAKAHYHHLMVVDYSNPSAVNDNAELYCHNQTPFVMGTTGGDRKRLVETVEASPISAVIAPNMAKQIVGLQAMFDYAANTFPGLFSGYSLTVKESHQQNKADTSGTAKAIIQYFEKLGAPMNIADIKMERNPEQQRKIWGIPEESIAGHGWHTYTLVSADHSVKFEFIHNVNGRDIYAQGTIDALIFLQLKISAGEKGKAYSMIDVLTG